MAQFQFLPATDGCGFDSATPTVMVEGSTAEIATRALICFAGFSNTEPIETAVTVPGGAIRRETLPPDSDPALEWLVLPGHPLGTYEVVGTQGVQSATGLFSVIRASSPRGLALPPYVVRPGDTFRVGLAGFPPDSDIPLYLYRSGGVGATFVTVLSPARADPNGEAIYSLPIQSGDPPGGYHIRSSGNARFEGAMTIQG